MTLRELRIQREQFRAMYAAISGQAARATGESQPVVLLYRGLGGVKFANQRLHPEVANLEPLLHEFEHGHASAEAIGFWKTALEQELARGWLRADVVYIF